MITYMRCKSLRAVARQDYVTLVVKCRPLPGSRGAEYSQHLFPKSALAPREFFQMMICSFYKALKTLEDHSGSHELQMTALHRKNLCCHSEQLCGKFYRHTARKT